MISVSSRLRSLRIALCPGFLRKHFEISSSWGLFKQLPPKKPQSAPAGARLCRTTSPGAAPQCPGPLCPLSHPTAPLRGFAEAERRRSLLEQSLGFAEQQGPTVAENVRLLRKPSYSLTGEQSPSAGGCEPRLPPKTHLDGTPAFLSWFSFITGTNVAPPLTAQRRRLDGPRGADPCCTPVALLLAGPSSPWSGNMNQGNV